MDRRDFLKVLGAAAISVVTADLWTPPPTLAAIVPPLDGLARVSMPTDEIFDIILCGTAERSQVATLDVIRPNGDKLMALALNTFGGILRWVAAPGEELRGPLQFVYSADAEMKINVVGRHADNLSWSTIEPGQSEPVLIPTTPEWHAVLTDNIEVPEVFRKAFDGLA